MPNTEVIRDTTLYPYASVVRVLATFENGMRFQGSGVVIGRNDVLTAAHVVTYDGEYAVDIEVTPAYDILAEPFGTFEADAFQTGLVFGNEDYITWDQISVDYALLTINDPEPVGEVTGWLKMRPDAVPNSDTTVSSAGYPAVHEGQFLTQITGTQFVNYYGLLSGFELSYDASGISGGPIWIEEPDGTRYVVGLESSTGADFFIDREAYDEIRIWAASNDAPNIRGSSEDDTLIGGMMDDTIRGFDGEDRLVGQRANDQLFGNGGADHLFGGEGNDIVGGGDGADLAFGGTGADWLRGAPGDDTLKGDDGRDTVEGGTGADRLFGGRGGDEIYGHGGDDRIWGGGGPGDTIRGGAGDDEIRGEGGDDKVFGGRGLDLILGGSQGDRLHGGAGDDLVFGEDGDDSVFGNDGADRIGGGAGDDVVLGGAGDDTLFGGVGNDTLFGSDGNDLLFGQDGNDELRGGNGADVLYGGAGFDTLIGGAGADRFEFAEGDTAVLGHQGDGNAPGFQHGLDVIAFWGGPGSFGDLDIKSTEAQGQPPDVLLADVIIAHGATQVFVANADVDAFTADDFLFL